MVGPTTVTCRPPETCVVRATASGRHSGTPVETRVAHEFTFRDGLIVRVKAYADRAEALTALGLEA